MSGRRAATKVAVVTGVGLAVFGVAGAPAIAAVKVDAENVGAAGATITFTADGESPTAGISGLRTFLPQNISAETVSLASGPRGWSLTRNQDGFTVSGPALPPQQDARYSVIMKLPEGVQKFLMRTTQQYSDGTTVRWIDVAGSGGANAAPVLDLNPPQPPPAVVVEEPESLLASVPSSAWVLGGGIAAALAVGFFWGRTRAVY